jgi:hypothetical protein
MKTIQKKCSKHSNPHNKIFIVCIQNFKKHTFFACFTIKQCPLIISFYFVFYFENLKKFFTAKKNNFSSGIFYCVFFQKKHNKKTQRKNAKKKREKKTRKVRKEKRRKKQKKNFFYFFLFFLKNKKNKNDLSVFASGILRFRRTRCGIFGFFKRRFPFQE